MSFNASLPIDFTGFTAAGFQPVPDTGQLDSDFWRVQGFSDLVGGDNVLDYGESITVTGDYARGVLSGDPTTAGIYAANTGVPALGTSFVIQPTGAEFGTTPGTITLRVQYTGASPLTEFTLDYDGVIRNSGSRSSTVDFSYAVQSAATQPTTFSATVGALSFATPDVLAAGATFTAEALAATTITNAVNPGDFIFLRWTIGDNTVTPGSGSRDEVGFDNILITAGGGTPATPTLSLRPTAVSQSEGNAGSTAFNYAINRSDVTPGDATVSITINGGTGFTAADITSVTLDGAPVAGFTLGNAFNASLTGAATTAALVVNVAGDTVVEADETFNIAITSSTAGYTLGNAAATATALDDDSTTTAISAIQGSGTASPLVGNTVTIEGVVTGDYQNGDADGNRNLQGFFVQMITGDGNAATSDGIFVRQADAILGTNVNVGDIVRVTGSVVEAFTQTQLSVANSNTGISVVTAGAYTPAQVINDFALDVNFPAVGTVVANGRVIPDLEFAEGMLIHLPQTMTISEAFNFDRFGEIRVAQGGQVTQFTQTNLPDAPGFQTYLNDLGSRSLLIDDGLSVQNPNPLNFFGTPLTTANAPQIGDGLSGLVGNLGYDFSEYRLQVSQAPTVVDTQPRPELPTRADGDIKVAGFNVLNYFTTLNAGGNTTGPGNAFEPRGANNALELERQTQKLYQGLTAIDADLVIVNELENDGFGAGSAIRQLVDGYNAAIGAPGRWSFVDPGVQFLGGDAIKVSMLYRTDKLAIATGTTAQVLDDSDIPGLISANLLPSDFLSQSTVGGVFNGVNTSRAVLVTSFQQLGSGEVFTAAAVHNKSKSGTGTGLDSDQNDGAGNWNNQRALATQALDAFLKTNPTGSADPDKIILGDFNSYARERSTEFLSTTAGYSNLVAEFIGNDTAASFVFDGQKGYLDGAYSSASLKPFVRTVEEYRANSPEFDAIDYNTDFGRPTTIFDGTNPFRNSDHDPVLVNLKLDPGLLVARAGTTVTVSDSFLQATQGAVAGDTITVRKAAAVTDANNAGIYAESLTVDTAAAGFFVMGTGIANLIFAGAGNVSAGGNEGGNTIIGNDGANTLAGNDGNDALNGDNGTDQLFGGNGNDTLIGGADNDVLYGGAGNDSMIGGTGNDAYVVDELADIVVEAVGGGIDTAFVTVNDWTNFADVEIVRLSGTATRLFGSFGNEDLVSNQTAASVIDGQGGDDTLWGSSFNDVLNGNLGNDILRGQGGADQFFGGAGDDQFVVFDAASVITENANEGYDVAYFVGSGTFNIGANVEEARLFLGGTGLIGNAGDNLLAGNNAGLASNINGAGGNDIIFGTVAADTLIGGAGNDTIYTQGGADTIRYDATGWGVDQIAGFTPGAKLQFTASSGVNGFGDLNLNVAGGNTQVNNAGGTILVFGASLTASDFIFG